MVWAAGVGREISNTIWSKKKTILLKEFRTDKERQKWIEENELWVPVNEKLPELKKYMKEVERNPEIKKLPPPIRVWVDSKSKSFPNIKTYLDQYKDEQKGFK